MINMVGFMGCSFCIVGLHTVSRSQIFQSQAFGGCGRANRPNLEFAQNSGPVPGCVLRAAQHAEQMQEDSVSGLHGYLGRCARSGSENTVNTGVVPSAKMDVSRGANRVDRQGETTKLPNRLCFESSEVTEGNTHLDCGIFQNLEETSDA